MVFFLCVFFLKLAVISEREKIFNLRIPESEVRIPHRVV